MQRKTIKTKRTYTHNGEQKTQWLDVGQLKTLDDGRQFIDLNMYPETTFFVFEQKERNEQQAPQQASQMTPEQQSTIAATPQNDETISVENIPF